MPKNQGFTLVELIAVILLIGILSVTALPKLSLVDKSSALIEARDRLVSVLRHTQLQAMQNTQTDVCHKVLLYRGQRFGQLNQCDNNSLPANFSPDYLGYSTAEASETQLRVKINGNLITNYESISFNSLGIPNYFEGSTCQTSARCEIGLTINNQTEIIYIEPQGYIHL